MAQNASMAEFEALLNESFEMDTPEEGSVVKGKVIAIEAGQAIIDVGYKMEGRVDLKEFANPGEAPQVAVGDEVEVFLRSAENAKGEAVISREMARREEAWDRLEKAYAEEARVGAVFLYTDNRRAMPSGKFVIIQGTLFNLNGWDKRLYSKPLSFFHLQLRCLD